MKKIPIRPTLLPALAAALAVAPALSTAARAQAPATFPAARVDSVFAAFARPGSPGCAVGVIRDGAMVYERGYGLAVLEHEVPITPRTVFDIASTSKQITAAVVLLLARDGKLSLDDDVRRHVPELPDYGATITLRHLLHHTSGLRDYIDLLLLGGSSFGDVTTKEDALEAIARQKSLNFRPGTEHLYSNSGYFLLSLIAERVSGNPMAQLARERIFAPLGMADTRYRDDYRAVVPRRALAYAPGRQPGEWVLDVSAWEQTGDGAVLTTVEDLARWDANFYDPRVGGPELIRELLATTTLADSTPVPYARGLTVDRQWNLQRVSHSGAWGGYRSELVRFPERRTSVAVLCNAAVAASSAYAMRVAEIALAGAVPPEPAAGAPSPPARRTTRAQLEPFAGVYLSEGAAQVRRVEAADSMLVLSGGSRPFDLVPVGERRFAQTGSEFVWEFSEPGAGGTRTLRRLRPGDVPAVFTRIADARPTSEDLASYAGTYRSEEARGTFTVTVEDGALVVASPGFGRARFAQAATRDVYAGGSTYLRFVRDAEGRVAAFTLTTRGVRNLRFDRE